jgi:hypothetical protein
VKKLSKDYLKQRDEVAEALETARDKLESAAAVAVGRDETHVAKSAPIELVHQGVVVVPRCAHCYEPATHTVTASSTTHVCDWHHRNPRTGGQP